MKFVDPLNLITIFLAFLININYFNGNKYLLSNPFFPLICAPTDGSGTRFSLATGPGRSGWPSPRAPSWTGTFAPGSGSPARTFGPLCYKKDNR
jgi:hypothetical protein